jgi:hypothetical protein
VSQIPEIRPEQSLELLKELHILTRDGKLNQDSRRKLKQVYHLYQFIEPLLAEVMAQRGDLTLVDHGAGKSYLGFILYDLFLKAREQGQVFGIETRAELVANPRAGAAAGLCANVAAQSVGRRVHRLTAAAATGGHRHRTACLRHGHRRRDPLRPGEAGAVHRAGALLPGRSRRRAAPAQERSLAKTPLAEIWRHPIHTREFGSQITNVLRCLLLESHGYRLTVTELVGWEHSMKNELIIARRGDAPRGNARERLGRILTS